MGNLFSDLPSRLPEELLETLVDSPAVRIERIVSTGQASPEGFWYDQPQHELVVLLAGAARLRLEESDTGINLSPGDYLVIPAHCRHRVEWTDPAVPTVWLAVHYASSE